MAIQKAKKEVTRLIKEELIRLVSALLALLVFLSVTSRKWEDRYCFSDAVGVWSRAPDKREYFVIIRDNVCLFSIKTYVVTPHLNHLIETVQMRGHNI